MQPKIKLSLLIPALVLAGGISFASAEEASRPRPVMEARKEIRDDRAEMRTGIKGLATTTRAEMKDARGVMRENTQNNREEFRNEAKQMRAASSTPEEIKAKREAMKLENEDARKALKAEFESKRAAMKSDIKAKITAFKEGKKVKLDEARKERVSSTLDKAFDKLSAAIVRLEEFGERVSDAIARRKDNGADTVAAEAALVDANSALSDAKASVEAAKSALTESLGGAEGISKEAVKDAARKALESVRNAKEKFVAVLKALPERNDDSATSTTTAQ